MEFEEEATVTVYNINRSMRGEVWLVSVTVILLVFMLVYLSPEKHETPSPVTPSVARALGWCEVEKGK